MQHFVENLLKVLKVLKTRTALTMNGLAEFRMRSTRQGAKALSKQRSADWLQNYYKMQKLSKKLLTNDMIEAEKEREIDKND